MPPNAGCPTRSTSSSSRRVEYVRDGRAFPDTLVGTDWRTTMVNGLGVLGWGVGGIEAEAAMLGEAISMLRTSRSSASRLRTASRGCDCDDLVLTV